MQHKTHITITLVLLLSIALAWGCKPARAHTPNPIACLIAWQEAPVGSKWTALQRCKRMQHLHILAHVCALPRPMIPYARVKGLPASYAQRRNISVLLGVARRLHSSRKVMIAAVATATQESSIRELPYGHGTSLGPFQLISDHGPAYLRQRIGFSSYWFLPKAINIAYHKPYLTIGETSQAVQRSAYPHAYDQWVDEARRTVRTYLGYCPR